MATQPPFVSLHGRRLGLTPQGLMADGVLLGTPFVGDAIIRYVDSGVAGASGESPAEAVSTLAAAIAMCTSGRGDIIVVMPGHAETVSAAGGIAINKASITIVGLGTGNSRPTFTVDTANTATIAVSVADVSISNCLFVANFLSIATCFALTTAKNFTLTNCTFKDTSGVLNFLNCVKSTGAANTVDGLTLIGNTWNGLGTTSVNSFVLTANDIDSLTMRDNNVKVVTTVDASHFLTVTAGVLTNLDVSNNRLYTKQAATTAGSLIDVGGTTSTGWVYRNFVQTLTTSGDKLFTTTVGLSAFENRVTGVVGATGFVIPAVDS